MFEVFQEVMHQISLLPLVILLVVYQRNKMVTSTHWLIATALSVSWFADSIGSLLIRQGVDNALLVPHLFYIPQLGLMLFALVRKVMALWFLSIGLFFLTLTTWLGGDYLTVPVVGGLIIAWYVAQVNLDVLGAGITIYFGLSALFWAMYMLNFPDSLSFWYPYQYARLAGIILVTFGMVSYKPELKVVKDGI